MICCSSSIASFCGWKPGAALLGVRKICSLATFFVSKSEVRYAETAGLKRGQAFAGKRESDAGPGGIRARVSAFTP